MGIELNNKKFSNNSVVASRKKIILKINRSLEQSLILFKVKWYDTICGAIGQSKFLVSNVRLLITNYKNEINIFVGKITGWIKTEINGEAITMVIWYSSHRDRENNLTNVTSPLISDRGINIPPK